MRFSYNEWRMIHKALEDERSQAQRTMDRIEELYDNGHDYVTIPEGPDKVIYKAARNARNKLDGILNKIEEDEL